MVANVIYTSIIGTVDISWDFTIGVYMPILAVECIVILIEKCIKSKAKKAEKN